MRPENRERPDGEIATDNLRCIATSATAHLASSLVAAADEIDRLRARVVELSDRNDAALEEGRSRFWRLRAKAAEARLAEIEADRDQWQESTRRFCLNADYWRGRAEAAEARLAEVEAVLEAHRGMGPKPGMDSAGYDLWSDVADATAHGADDHG
jgi:hypothetical protein